MELILNSLSASSSHTPTPAWNDEDLVDLCLRGSELAWAAVLDKYKGLVYQASTRYHLSSRDATDLFHEVWLELYCQLENLRKPGALGDWLIAFTWHKCLRWESRRRQAAEPEQVSAPVETVTETPFPQWQEQARRQQILRDSLAQLPECCRRMFDLLFYLDPPITCAEATRQLALAEGALGFHRGHCLDNLRAVLEEKGF